MSCVRQSCYEHSYRNLCWTYAFIPLVKIPRCGMAGSYHACCITLKSCQTVFQSGLTILYSHQQCRRVPVSLCPCRHLLWSVFLILAALTGMQHRLLKLSLRGLGSVSSGHSVLLDSQLRHLSSFCLLGSVRVPAPSAEAWNLSPGSKQGRL